MTLERLKVKRLNEARRINSEKYEEKLKEDAEKKEHFLSKMAKGSTVVTA